MANSRWVTALTRKKRVAPRCRMQVTQLSSAALRANMATSWPLPSCSLQEAPASNKTCGADHDRPRQSTTVISVMEGSRHRLVLIDDWLMNVNSGSDLKHCISVSRNLDPNSENCKGIPIDRAARRPCKSPHLQEFNLSTASRHVRCGALLRVRPVEIGSVRQQLLRANSSRM